MVADDYFKMKRRQNLSMARFCLIDQNQTTIKGLFWQQVRDKTTAAMIL